MSATRQQRKPVLLPDAPSHDDLAVAIHEIHGSLEEHKEEVREEISALHSNHKKLAREQERMRRQMTKFASSQAATARTLERIGLDQQIIKDALGLSKVTTPDPKLAKRKPLALMSQWEAFWKGMGAVSSGIMALFFAIKFIRLVGPGIVTFVGDEWHVIDKLIMGVQ